MQNTLDTPAFCPWVFLQMSRTGDMVKGINGVTVAGFQFAYIILVFRSCWLLVQNYSKAGLKSVHQNQNIDPPIIQNVIYMANHSILATCSVSECLPFFFFFQILHSSYEVYSMKLTNKSSFNLKQIKKYSIN